MKNILLGSIAFVGITLLASCQKHKDDKSEVVICTGPFMDGKLEQKNIVLAPNQSYSLDLGSFGDEEGAIIQQQAVHYSISSVERTTSTANYRYQPATDFTGDDVVIIKSSRGSNGAGTGSNLTYTYIHFTITSNSVN
jgi:hypothetical protein